MTSPSVEEDSVSGKTRQQRAGETMRQRSRVRLLLGAAEVFDEQGYAGTTVTAVAVRAGVSLRTLYTAWGKQVARIFCKVAERMASPGGSCATVQPSTHG